MKKMKGFVSGSHLVTGEHWRSAVASGNDAQKAGSSSMQQTAQLLCELCGQAGHSQESCESVP